MRRIGWVAAFVAGVVAIFVAQTWVWWQADPHARGTTANALWARHQWVGMAHTDAEYRSLGALLRQNAISDVFFHAGPFAADGSVPPALYAHAGELIRAMRTYAPGVHLQAYLGQVRRVDGEGVLPLDDPAVRARIVRADKEFLDLGFDGIHYDIEPIYPDDSAFLDLLERTRELTRARGRILSASLEQLTLADAVQPLFGALVPRSGPVRYPPRPTESYLRKVADRVDQVAIMTYDSDLPTGSLVGRHFAWHTERTLELIGDRVTVFMGVPAYRPLTYWAEDLPTALRGIRRGLDALPHRPAKPFGVGVYADWTTSAADWARYRAGWLPKAENRHIPG
jgi:hypothetical protein